MAIRPNDRRRLARLAMPLVSARRDEVNHRVELRKSVDFFEHLQGLLRLERIDPERTCAMGHLREAKATLAAIPDTPELQRADAEYLARAEMSVAQFYLSRIEKNLDQPGPEWGGEVEIHEK